MTKLFNFEFTIEHEEMTKAEKEKAEDKLEAVFNEIFGDEWVGTWNWDYKPHYEAQPTVDAEPIIRCKDCKYSKSIDSKWLECQHDKRCMKENGFCSWAERRGEE